MERMFEEPTQSQPSPARHVFEFAKYAISVGWDTLDMTRTWKAYLAWSERYGDRIPADELGRRQLRWNEFEDLYSKIDFDPETNTLRLESHEELLVGTIQ